MKLFESKHFIALVGVLALVFSGCASDGSKPTDQQIEAPQTITSEPDKSLFSQALKAQNEGQLESAVKMWKSFLAKHPDSFEGHNNLGLIYYTQDRVSQALQEFETAHRLQPFDPRIRKNLARSLRFKASMLHENREYFKTLEVLARLELIVEPEEKQALLFKQEQVEDQIYLQVIKANNSAAYQDFVNRFPDGLNAVRAREYLKEHPYKVSKSTSQTKSWISSGKKEDLSSWASSEQPPDYSASRPTATYTPPPPGTSKKTGDFFGTDSAAVEDTAEEHVATAQDVNPIAVVPFEDFEKPERSSGEHVETEEPAGGKDNRRVVSESNPISGETDEVVAAGLDTLPDLKPIPVAELPAEEDAPSSADTLAGDIQIQPAEQETEKAVTASVEDAVERATQEEVTAVPSENDLPEQVQPEPAQEMKEERQAESEEKTMEKASAGKTDESAASDSVESESERMARIIKEEIAKEESLQSEQAPVEQTPVEQVQPTQAEPVQEVKAEPEASPDENTMEVARFNPEDQTVTQEAPAESSAVEATSSTPDSGESVNISQETVSETVAALVPSPPPAKAMETPMDSSNTMVVIEMREGSTLNVRANPSTQGEILGYLENGDTMPFMSESGDWYQIEIEEGLSGWVSKKYSTTRNVTAEASIPTPSVPAATMPVSEEMMSELSPLGADPNQPSEAMVIVTVSEDATLNVRSLPSPTGAVVDMLFGGDKLPLVKEEGEWYQVRFEDETTGWISKKFSVIEGSTSKVSLPAPTAKKTKPRTPSEQSKEMVTTVVLIKVPEGSSLNVRSVPSSEGAVVGSLKRGEMRPLLEETGEWYQVELDEGQSGWVSQKFSSKMNVDPSFVQSP